MLRGRWASPPRPRWRTQVCVWRRAGDPGAGVCRGFSIADAGGKAVPESRASIAFFPPLAPPPLLPFARLARHAPFLGGVGCWGARSQPRVGLKLRRGGRCCLLRDVAQRVGVAGVVPGTFPGPRAAGKVARAKPASQVLALQGFGGTNRRACPLPRLPAPLHPVGRPFFPLRRTRGGDEELPR